MTTEGREFDIVIFGASGFTGQYVVEYVTRIKDEVAGLRWAIAGRSEKKLRNALEEVSNVTGTDVKNISIIVASVDNVPSLEAMCKRTKMVLNCVGPYRFYGEPVVKACIENGCHHIDISGEPTFLEAMQLKYHEAAQNAKVFVLGAAGFDSIPCETGIQFLQEKFGGDINSVETFGIPISGPSKAGINFGTWHSLIYGIANRKELGPIRAAIFANPVPRSSHRLKNRGILFHGEEVNKWCMTFPVTDKSVVTRTQHYNYHNRKLKPIQIYTYLVMPSLFYALLTGFVGAVFGIFANFKFGRVLLEKFPSIFSFGLFSKTGPTRKQVAEASFRMILVAKGFPEKLSEPQDQHTGAPCKTMIASIEGPEPGYITTPICMVHVGLTVLQEKDKLPKEGGGVLTPGAALYDTSLISRLVKNGLKYEILSK